MLDDLRDQTSFQPEEPEPPEEAPKRSQRPSSNKRKGGLTASQRFVLALMFLVVVCLMGVVILAVTGKIVLPFGY